jgi:pantoate--beta-alanine ligase
VREADGLAMSSRNARLSEADRVRACAISRGLRAACAQPEAQGAQAVLMDSILRAGLEPEYAVVRDADTLTRTPAQGGPGPWRVLAAARLSGVRLLDNAPWPA